MRNDRIVQVIEGLAREFGFSMHPTPTALHPYLIGAEGEGKEGDGDGDAGGDSSGSGDGDSGAGSTDGGDDADDEGDSGDDGDDSKTFSKAYVEKLRRENAANRVKANTAEEELTKRKKAEMDELTLAKTEKTEQETRATKAETELSRLRLELAVSQAAAVANFYDPGDALSLIPSESIALNDDGLPNKQSVEAAVKRLADAKPHLVKGKGTGTGDGGARGKGSGTIEDKQAEYDTHFQQIGGVPKPK